MPSVMGAVCLMLVMMPLSKRYKPSLVVAHIILPSLSIVMSHISCFTSLWMFHCMVLVLYSYSREWVAIQMFPCRSHTISECWYGISSGNEASLCGFCPLGFIYKARLVSNIIPFCESFAPVIGPSLGDKANCVVELSFGFSVHTFSSLYIHTFPSRSVFTPKS